MKIYNIHDKEIINAPLTERAILEQELSKADSVRLSWNSDNKRILPVGAYIVPFSDGIKYCLLDPYTPTESNTGFKYEPTFYHPVALLSRIPYLYSTTDKKGRPIKQQEWSFNGQTTDALTHITEYISKVLGVKFSYTLCGTVPQSVSFSINGNDVLSALGTMAGACKGDTCEWHISWEHKCLYFGQISINLAEKVPLLKVHDNIQVASISESKEPFYNCYYVQGSSKNMSEKAEVGTGNVATMQRLTLDEAQYPDGCVYTDNQGEIISKEDFYKGKQNRQMLALRFDDVYPHMDLYVYDVRHRTRYLKDKDTGKAETGADGKEKVYATWYMRLAYPAKQEDSSKTLINTTVDNGITYYWYDYALDVKEQVLQGRSLKGLFVANNHSTNGKFDALTQSLVGQPIDGDGFELIYHEEDREVSPNAPEGDSGVHIRQGDYEIKFVQNGDSIIPTTTEEGLIPRGNAKPDHTCNKVVLFNIRMGETEIKQAQNELAERAAAEVRRRSGDKNNYTFKVNPVAFSKKNAPALSIGQRVTYDDGEGHALDTRIIKIATHLDRSFDKEVTVGNQAVKGAITQLKDDVRNILSGNFSGGGLNEAQISEIVKNYTLPRFLRKDTADEARGHVSFLRGVTALVKSFFNGIFNRGDIENKGDIRNSGTIQTKNLTVTGKATFFELEILKAKAAGGMTVNSASTFHIDAVYEDSDGWRCFQRAEQDGTKLLQMCKIGDQMMCARFNIGDNGNTYYWRKVTEAPTKHVYCNIDGEVVSCLQITLSKSDRDMSSDDAPQVGDELAQVGNRTDKDRQSVIMTSAYRSFDADLKTPYFAHYTGVDNYNLSAHKRTWLAANGSHITGRLKVESDSGEESIEDYIGRLTDGPGKATAVYKLMLSASQLNAGSDGNFSPQYIHIYACKIDGEGVTYLKPDDSVKVDVSQGEYFMPVHGELSFSFVGDRWTLFPSGEDPDETYYVDLRVDGRLMDRQTISVVRDGADGKPGRDGVNGVDAVSYKLIPTTEHAMAYRTNDNRKCVSIDFSYMIQKSAGEEVKYTSLSQEGMTLTMEPSAGAFKLVGGFYRFSQDGLPYRDSADSTYRVVLKKGGEIADRRIIPVTFKPKVLFDIDTELGAVKSGVSDVSGKQSTLEQNVNGLKTTVKDGAERISAIEQRTNSISLRVQDGTMPNLLWSSEFDLDSQRPNIQRMYDYDAKEKQAVREKQELRRELSETPEWETGKRQQLQSGIDECDEEIERCRSGKTKCHDAIAKHLGITMDTLADSGHFKYIRGGGVSGSNALMIKSDYGVRGEWKNNIRWDNIKIKPGTYYTISAWIKFDGHGKSGRAYVSTDGENDTNFSYENDGVRNYFREDVKEWTRLQWTFNSGDNARVESLYFCCLSDDSQGAECTLWISRPKLEEGKPATAWRAYDGIADKLLATGVDIENKKVIVTADNFKIRNKEGKEIFLVDKDGRIAAPIASIGDWHIRDGRIVSTPGDGESVIRLDANVPRIEVVSSQTGGGYGKYGKDMDTRKPSTISIDALTGQIEARGSEGNAAYVSANGIFANHPMVNAWPATLGYSHYGAIVASAVGHVDKSYSETVLNMEDSVVSGVYGFAMNRGTAPAYGGYFYDLKVCGFIPKVYYLTDRDANHQLTTHDHTVVGLVNARKVVTVYLPRNAKEGQEIEVFQMGDGTARADTNDGSHIYDDLTENDYYDVDISQHAVFRKVRYGIGKQVMDIWIVKKV